MRRLKHRTAATRLELLQTFSEIDCALQEKGVRLHVTTVGGVSIILLGFRERSTCDIDIANVGDALEFQKFCAAKNIQVDIISVTSTVDFAHASKVSLYSGKMLKVDSIIPEELLKMKLERFRKQDPEDIFAIIQKTAIDYKRFKSIVEEMLTYFIGNHRELLISALVVVEQMFPDKREDFKNFLSKH